MVGVAQLVRAPGCGPGCRGFESPRSPHCLCPVTCGFDRSSKPSLTTWLAFWLANLRDSITCSLVASSALLCCPVSRLLFRRLARSGKSTSSRIANVVREHDHAVMRMSIRRVRPRRIDHRRGDPARRRHPPVPVLYPARSLPVPGPACCSSRSVLVRSPQRIFHPPSRSTAVRSRPLRVRPRRFTTSSMCVPPAGPGLVA
jgi:hypothetical protein